MRQRQRTAPLGISHGNGVHGGRTKVGGVSCFISNNCSVLNVTDQLLPGSTPSSQGKRRRNKSVSNMEKASIEPPEEEEEERPVVNGNGIAVTPESSEHEDRSTDASVDTPPGLGVFSAAPPPPPPPPSPTTTTPPLPPPPATPSPPEMTSPEQEGQLPDIASAADGATETTDATTTSIPLLPPPPPPPSPEDDEELGPLPGQLGDGLQQQASSGSHAISLTKFPYRANR
ncbi:hypothetical protein CRUP_036480 [Coryphaenoides rupestris]|nr:hypothetical protein CRUP_036480 [Coryphaenoides rupestris]